MDRNLFSRGLDRMATLWRPATSAPAPAAIAKPKPNRALRQMRDQLGDCAREAGGQVTARTRAAGLGEAYRALEASGKLEFLELLARDFGPDPKVEPSSWKSGILGRRS